MSSTTTDLQLPEGAKSDAELIEEIVQSISAENSDWIKAFEAAGHTPKKDEEGGIDWFAKDEGYHNGPECTSCGETWCHHCTSPQQIKPCPGPSHKLAKLRSLASSYRQQAQDIDAEIERLDRALDAPGGSNGE